MSTLKTAVQDDVLVVYFQDVRIIDETRIESLSNELLSMVPRAEQKKMLLSFHNVKFMASSMIGKIILLFKKCKEAHVDLRFCEVSENIMEVFRLMKLDDRLDIKETEKEALESFKEYKKKWYV